MENIQVNYEEIIGTKKDKSPIWFVNMHGTIKTLKGRKTTKVFVKRQCIKGTLEEAKKHRTTKARFLKAYFKSSPNPAKKVKDFNFDLLEIEKIEIIKFLGYGVKLQ